MLSVARYLAISGGKSPKGAPPNPSLVTLNPVFPISAVSSGFIIAVPKFYFKTMIMECICEGDEFCFGWDQKRDITNYTILLTARAILTSVSIPIGIIIFMSSIPWVERNQIDLLLGQGYRLESGLTEMLAGLDNPIILSREQVDELSLIHI